MLHLTAIAVARRSVVPALAAILCLVGCTAARSVAPAMAIAELRNAQDRVVGTASFTQLVDGVRIIMDVRDMPPGLKGVHIHQVGACEPPDFISAGQHLDPERRQHGLLNPDGPHAGDLPNITIGADGTGRLETTTDRVTLGSGTRSLFHLNGSAIIVHAAPDDHVTDPDGGTGPRLACGPILRQ